MNRLVRFDRLGTPRFLTLSCYHRRRLLARESVIRLFLSELDTIRHKYELKLYGYVVMPEHVHLVVLPPLELTLSKAIGELKSRSARTMLAFLRDWTDQPTDELLVSRDGKTKMVFWQRRYYDHNCRSVDTLREKIVYCHQNPVNRGLVSDPANWQWSSYNAWKGVSSVPIVIDTFER